jgi:protein phosphatase 1 regulatory subunit 7
LHIRRIEGLDALVNLEELYLSHNGIEKMEGLEKLAKLNTLDLSANRLAAIDGVGSLTRLEEFWFNDNQLANWHDVDKLRVCPSLNCVYFERNPIAKDSGYRRKLQLALPSLKQIDATFTRADVRHA